jgi:hypothetical protein
MHSHYDPRRQASADTGSPLTPDPPRRARWWEFNVASTAVRRYPARALLILTAMLQLAVPALAGHIYGTLRHAGRTLPPGYKVELQGCDQQSTQTDHNGAYRFFVKSTGRCKLVVVFNQRAYQGEVFSYPQPTAYDFDLPPDSTQMKRR